MNINNNIIIIINNIIIVIILDEIRGFWAESSGSRGDGANWGKNDFQDDVSVYHEIDMMIISFANNVWNGLKWVDSYGTVGL